MLCLDTDRLNILRIAADSIAPELFFIVFLTLMRSNDVIIFSWITFLNSKCTLRKANVIKEKKNNQTYPCKRYMFYCILQYQVLLVLCCKKE